MKIKFRSKEATESQLPIICLAWCNKDMLDSAPKKQDDAAISLAVAPKLINHLVS